MPQSLTKVYIHLIFSTKHRHPFIDNSIENKLWKYIGGICKSLGCNPVKVGGTQDHIHICCLLSKDVKQCDFVLKVKKQSSKWIKTEGEKYKNFYWQSGYGIFSVNPSEIDIVVNYIENQKEHHKKRSFQEEFVAFLNKYRVEYNERYLWD